MRHLSESTAKVAAQNFSRKYIALGRIVNQWAEIIGADMADKAQPIKIRYRKDPKTKKALATLEIATSNALATTLPYRKGLILERINHIFGKDWITDIKFTASELEQKIEAKVRKKASLTDEDEKYITDTLAQIDDPDIKARLESFGKHMLLTRKDKTK
tara:strand:- start:112 stop:588 length:477 start_codon:yes stop_codon:yes gene_type:complete